MSPAESLKAQCSGLTGPQLTCIELLGAMLERAKDAGAVAASAYIDQHGCFHIDADFVPVEITESEG